MKIGKYLNQWGARCPAWRARERRLAVAAFACGLVLIAAARGGPSRELADLAPSALLGGLLAALGGVLAFPAGRRKAQALAALFLLCSALTVWTLWVTNSDVVSLSAWPSAAVASLAAAGVLAGPLSKRDRSLAPTTLALLAAPPLLLALGYAMVLPAMAGKLLVVEAGPALACVAAALGLVAASGAVALQQRNRLSVPGDAATEGESTAFWLRLLITLGLPLTAAAGAVLGGAVAAHAAFNAEMARQQAHLQAHAQALAAELQREGVRHLTLSLRSASSLEAPGHAALYWRDGAWWLKRTGQPAQHSLAAAALFEGAHAADASLSLCQVDGEAGNRLRCWERDKEEPVLWSLSPRGYVERGWVVLETQLPDLGLTVVHQRSVRPVATGALQALRTLLLPALGFALVGVLLTAWRVTPLVRRLESLRRHLAVLLDQLPAAVFTLNSRGEVQAANVAAEALLGLRVEAKAGAKGPIDEVLAALRAEGRVSQHVSRSWRNLEGHPVDVEITSHELAGEDPGARVVLVRDVTQRKQTEQRLLEVAWWKEAVLRAAADGICVVDPAGRLLFANPVALEILGLPDAAAPTATSPAEVAQRYVAPWRALVEGALQKADTFRSDLELALPNGELRCLECVATPFGDARERLVVTLRDVTDTRRTVEALAFTTAMLRHTEEIGQIGSWHLDLRTGRTSWSHGKFRILGLPSDTPVTPDLHLRYVHPSDRDRLKQLIDRLMRTQEAHEVRYRIVVNGQVKWLQGRGSFSFNEHGHAVAWSGSVQDISDLQRRERELLASRRRVRELAARREGEREEERARLSREVHDELGQQLAALRLSVRRLEMQCELAGCELGSSLEEVKQGLDQTSTVVRSLVRHLRPAVLDIGLSAAVEWLSADFGSRHGFAVELENRLGEMQVPPATSTAVFRCLQEALTNVARHAAARQVLVRLDGDGSDLVLIVADDGRGFDPQTVRGLQGFGLMGMRERALALGGSMKLGSQPGRGVRLEFRVPLQVEANGRIDRVGDNE